MQKPPDTPSQYRLARSGQWCNQKLAELPPAVRRLEVLTRHTAARWQHWRLVYEAAAGDRSDARRKWPRKDRTGPMALCFGFPPESQDLTLTSGTLLCEWWR